MAETSKKTDTSKAQKKTNRLLLFFLIIASLVIILAGIILFPMFISGAEKDAMIYIPENATREMVRDSLKKHLGKEYSDRVTNYARIRNIDFSKRHGAYLIKEGTSPFKAVVQITRHSQTPVNITVNGFRTLSTLSHKIGDKLETGADGIYSASTDSLLLSAYGLNKDQGMALYLDDSYEIYWTTTPEALIKKIGDNYNKFWNVERRQKAEKLGLTPVEVTIIASIADEETNKQDEKGTIGRLYINRLQKGMKLQSDPTVRYALNDFTIKRVTGKHLTVDSPYNTYMYPGLPPAPIRTTSKATIDAILNSKPSNYLYMCAKEDFSGYHNFADNYSDHIVNALRYQHELDMRGIK